MDAVEENYSVTTRLLTLLNVSALSTRKRKREEDQELKYSMPPTKKLNSKKLDASSNVNKDDNNSGMHVDDVEGPGVDYNEQERLSVLIHIH